jgi:Family of unknown function (DUF6011)
MTLNIFHCNDARLHTLPEAPTLRVATHKQIIEHHDNLEALNTDKIVPRFGPDPDPDPTGEYRECRFFEHACHIMLAQEDNWRQCGLVWSWVDERPVWLSPVHWDLDILPRPEQPTLRRFRLSLLGGGQIRVSENFVTADAIGDGFVWCEHPELRVTADGGDGLRRYTGIIEDYHCEMAANAAVFLPGTPQSVADRVAQTFRLLDTGSHASVRGPDRDNFMALLDRSEACCICRRPLRDHVSTLLGIGPDCARQMRLPHNLDAASRILQRRKQLLGTSQ